MAWIDSGGGKLRSFDFDNSTNTLAPGIYGAGSDMNGPFVYKMHDRFELPKKIYTFFDNKYRRVVNSYQQLQPGKNLGVLLNGVKGTGKSLLSKNICNALLDKGVPVFLLENVSSVEYVNGFKQDVVIFLDEFEKSFREANDGDVKPQEKLLSITDGSKNSFYKRLFLLTTNSEYIDSNFIDRPSRIRYIFKFESLNREQISFIVEDLLENKNFKKDLMDKIVLLPIITVDIVVAVIQECNLYNEPYSEFIDYFNTRPEVNKYTIMFEGVSLKVYPYHGGYRIDSLPTDLVSRITSDEFVANNQRIFNLDEYAEKGEQKKKANVTLTIEPHHMLDAVSCLYKLTFCNRSTYNDEKVVFPEHKAGVLNYGYGL